MTESTPISKKDTLTLTYTTILIDKISAQFNGGFQGVCGTEFVAKSGTVLHCLPTLAILPQAQGDFATWGRGSLEKNAARHDSRGIPLPQGGIGMTALGAFSRELLKNELA